MNVGVPTIKYKFACSACGVGHFDQKWTGLGGEGLGTRPGRSYKVVRLDMID